MGQILELSTMSNYDFVIAWHASVPSEKPSKYYKAAPQMSCLVQSWCWLRMLLMRFRTENAVRNLVLLHLWQKFQMLDQYGTFAFPAAHWRALVQLVRLTGGLETIEMKDIAGCCQL
jgi:hypothetical protein